MPGVENKIAKLVSFGVASGIRDQLILTLSNKGNYFSYHIFYRYEGS